MRITIAGDSHGSMMIGILEGFPAGFKINEKKLNFDLERRKKAYGRSNRMNIEEDEVIIISGVWRGYTTGAPLTFTVKNKASNTDKSIRSVPRPGHADLPAWLRYKIPDFNAYAERASARWTVIFTAIGSFLKSFLREFGIIILSYVTSIGNVVAREIPEDSEEIIAIRDKTFVYCPDLKAAEDMMKEIDSAAKEGETLGGTFKVVAKSVPPGLGGFSGMYERIDSRIGKIFMALPAVKGLIIGNNNISVRGSEYHDPITVLNGKIKRVTNNAGGIEGGITNGEDVIVTVFVKPIPTVRKGIDSVDFKTFEKVSSPYIRSDVTAVPALSVIGESALSIVLTEVFLERFGNDSFESIKRRFESEDFPDWNDGIWEEYSW